MLRLPSILPLTTRVLCRQSASIGRKRVLLSLPLPQPPRNLPFFPSCSYSSLASDAQASEKEDMQAERESEIEQEEEAHHAVVSTFDLFSIGIGPSSSHTVGPMRAGKIFVEDLVAHKILNKVHFFRIDLYGSLALTGVGHGTPNACLMGVEGESPETVNPTSIDTRVKAMNITKTIKLNGTHQVRFDPEKDLVFHLFETLPQHPNGMRFTAMDINGDMLATNEYFSVGGGFVVNEETQVSHGENLYYKNYKAVEAPSERRAQDLAVTNFPFTNAEKSSRGLPSRKHDHCTGSV
ncbi:hypothetical protein DSO57_1013880 [Entomophthora muscae]|uniref:Uncharacterized protein n=1 Tax=Entomophthora muscae TaxID=34485 RepID=A0ACC2SUC8_9FUNG|nr:hypothetical protein DSO57_1013880 [Entomophthora muscae]